MQLDELTHLIAAVHFFSLPATTRADLELGAVTYMTWEETELFERLRHQVIESPTALLRVTDRDTGAITFMRLLSDALARDTEFFEAERELLRRCYAAPLQPLQRLILSLKVDLDVLEQACASRRPTEVR